MESQAPNIELNTQAIVVTIQKLRDRIRERFPASGLSNVAESLLTLAQQQNSRMEKLARPIIWVRIIKVFLIALIVIGAAGLLYSAQLPGEIHFFQIIQTFESGMNDIIMIGVGIFFMATLEDRLKRREALKSIHVLRSIAHVIDMHQLTKDPDRTARYLVDTASSPKLDLDRYQLSRYLSYCSEMLSLVGKLAALYLKQLDDPSVLDAVNEIEDLTTGLSGKIWQKIVLLDNMNAKLAGPAQVH